MMENPHAFSARPVNTDGLLHAFHGNLPDSTVRGSPHRFSPGFIKHDADARIPGYYDASLTSSRRIVP